MDDTGFPAHTIYPLQKALRGHKNKVLVVDVDWRRHESPIKPNAIFVVDVGYHKGAITEAAKLGIPVIGIVDTNHSPEGVTYVIPGNDDSSKAIVLYARGIADAILEGRANATNEMVDAIKNGAAGDEFVEVSEQV